jgi:hypothetical protein
MRVQQLVDFEQCLPSCVRLHSIVQPVNQDVDM